MKKNEVKRSMEGIRSVYKVFVRKQKGNDRSDDLGIDESLILKLVFKIKIGEYGLDSSVSGQENLSGSRQHGNKFSGSKKDGEILRASVK